MKVIVFACLLVLTLFSCTKEPRACFEYKTKGFVTDTHSFESCSDDYAFQFWTFGDGYGHSGSSVSHKYDSTGTYELQLKAYSKDGEKVSTQTQALTITYMVIDSVKVTYLSSLSNGSRIGFKFGINESSSRELHSVSLSDLPITFSFHNGVLVKYPTMQWAINRTGNVYHGPFLALNRREKMHDKYENPVKINSKGVKFLVYWHFRD